MFKQIGRFILPADVELRKRRLELLVWSFLLSLAFYPQYFGFIAWFALVRPLMIISSLKGRKAFNAAYFFSFFFNLFSLYWIAKVTFPGMITAVVIVAFYYTVVLVAFNRIYRFKAIYSLVLLPFLWVGMEYFRSLSQFSFPWSDLGYTQSYYLYIIQIVSITSVHGLSFLIVVVNVLLWQVFRKNLLPERRLTSFLFSLVIIFGLWAYGWIEVPKYPLPGKVEIALMQGSVPIEVKWAKGNLYHSLHLYDSLTQSVAKDSSLKLYVWPETAAPCYLTNNYSCRWEVGNIVRKSKSYHLVGAQAVDMINNKPHYYNSCFQFNPQGKIEQRYNKVKLVPFSEHVPYQDYLPFLDRKYLSKYLTFINKPDVQWWSDFYPGDSMVVFHLPEYNYAVLICFESAFPEYARQAIRKGADFLVGITNDTWFGRSVGISMHARIFLMRAVENRCWSARLGNSGITYIVDGYGRIREKLKPYDVAVLKGKLRPIENFSIFTKYGDVIGFYSFLITISILGILILLWLLQKLFLKK